MGTIDRSENRLLNEEGRILCIRQLSLADVYRTGVAEGGGRHGCGDGRVDDVFLRDTGVEFN